MTDNLYAQIRALVAEYGTDGGNDDLDDVVRRIITAIPAQTIDRDSARKVLRKRGDNEDRWITIDEAFDALEGCVRPAPAQTIDALALSELISTVGYELANRNRQADNYLSSSERNSIVDRVLALLRPAPAPAQTIDRDALVTALSYFEPPQQLADRVLALLRPVEGVTLTRDEAQRAVDWWDMSDARGGTTQRDLDLVCKLEAAL